MVAAGDGLKWLLYCTRGGSGPGKVWGKAWLMLEIIEPRCHESAVTGFCPVEAQQPLAPHREKETRGLSCRPGDPSFGKKSTSPHVAPPKLLLPAWGAGWGGVGGVGASSGEAVFIFVDFRPHNLWSVESILFFSKWFFFPLKKLTGHIPKSVFLLTSVESDYKTLPLRWHLSQAANWWTNFGNITHGGRKINPWSLNWEPWDQSSQLVICCGTLDEDSWPLPTSASL